MRANRLGGEPQHCSIYAETLLENILEEAKQMSPDLMIVDSVQTMYTEAMDSAAGSVSQIKEVAARLLRYAKESGVPVILIGHITKDGFIAGPKILEHIVDVVLQFEGDNRGSYRILRSIKNRFGSTSELATSLIWETEPAVESTLSVYMVCTESTIISSGLSCRASSSTFSSRVSA